MYAGHVRKLVLQVGLLLDARTQNAHLAVGLVGLPVELRRCRHRQEEFLCGR